MMQAATPWASRPRSRANAALTMLCALAALALQSGVSPAAAPIAVAVADFDYFDTSGEVTDQSEEHRARVASFAKLLRDNLAAGRLSRGADRMPRSSLHRHQHVAGSSSSPPREGPAPGSWSMAASAR